MVATRTAGATGNNGGSSSSTGGAAENGNGAGANGAQSNLNNGAQPSQGGFTAKVVYSVAKNFATSLPPLRSLDGWHSYEKQFFSNLIAATQTRPGPQGVDFAPVSLQQLRAWFDLAATADTLTQVPSDVDIIVHEGLMKICEHLKESCPSDEQELRDMMCVRHLDEAAFEQASKRRGTATMRAIRRHAKNIESEMEDRNKERYDNLSFTVGGTETIGSFLATFCDTAKEYYGPRYENEQPTIVKELVKKVYGVGPTPNDRLFKIREICESKGQPLTVNVAKDYLRKVLANTTAPERALAAVANPPLKKKSNSRRMADRVGPKRRAPRGHLEDAPKENDKRQKHACKGCNSSKHWRAKDCPKAQCFGCKQTGHLKRDCPQASKPTVSAAVVNSLADLDLNSDDYDSDTLSSPEELRCSMAIDSGFFQHRTKFTALFDTGANINVIGDSSLLHNYQKLAVPRKLSNVGISDGKILGFGKLSITLKGEGGKNAEVLLQQVAHVASATGLILSAHRLMEDGNFVVAPDLTYLSSREGTRIPIDKSKGVLELELLAPHHGPIAMAARAQQSQVRVNRNKYLGESAQSRRYYSFLHSCLGHVPVPVFRSICKATGIECDISTTAASSLLCEPCILTTQVSCPRTNGARSSGGLVPIVRDGENHAKAAKSRPSRLPATIRPKSFPGALLCMDWVKYPKSKAGNKGCFTFACRYTGYFVAEPSPSSSGERLALALEAIMLNWEHQPAILSLGTNILTDMAASWSGSRTNMGMSNRLLEHELRDIAENSRLGAICRHYRIRLSFTNPGHSNQNAAEAHHQIMRRLLRVCSADSGFDVNHWDSTWSSYCQLILNLRPAFNDGTKTRFAAFHGREFPVRKLRPLGCRAQLLRTAANRGAVAKARIDQGVSAIFVGYELSWHSTDRVSVLWLFKHDFNSGHIRASRDVVWSVFDRPLLEGAHVSTGLRRASLLAPIEAEPIEREAPRKPGRPRKRPAEPTTSTTAEPPKKRGRPPGKRSSQPTESTTPTTGTRRSPRTASRVAAALNLLEEDDPVFEYNSQGLDKVYLCAMATEEKIAHIIKEDNAQSWNVTPEHILEHWSGSATLREGATVPLEYSEPKTIRKALKCKHFARQWRESYAKEYQAMLDNKTWRRVNGEELKRLRGKCGRPIPITVVLKIKRHERVVRFKSRFCCLGNLQDKRFIPLTWAPTVREGSVNAILVVALSNKLKISLIDAKSAFLRGGLDSPLLLLPPPGLDLGGDLLCLEKNLYGLAVAARTWWLLLARLLTRYGLVQCEYDKSVWFHPKKQLLLCCHVDDVLLAANQGEAQKLAAFLRKSEENIETTIEDLSVHLGREYTPILGPDGAQNGLKVTVKRKIEELASHYTLPPRAPCPAPSTDTWMRSPTSEEVAAAKTLPFREVMGSLIWIARARPDVRYTVQRLARFSCGWGEVHFKTALRVVAYLLSTKNSGAIIRGTKSLVPQLETDASWADDKYDKRSTLAFTVTLGDSILETGSILDKSIATASAESEYRAASCGVKKLLFYRNLLEEIGCPVKGPSKHWLDNKAAISAIKNHERNLSEFAKHIAIAYHNTRLECSKGNIDPDHRHSDVLFTDCLTKPLGVDEHFKRCNSSPGFQLDKPSRNTDGSSNSGSSNTNTANNSGDGTSSSSNDQTSRSHRSDSESSNSSLGANGSNASSGSNTEDKS